MPSSAVSAPEPALYAEIPLMSEAARMSFAFGPFILRPGRQLLLKDEAPVRIGGRAFDILTVLIERPGDLVSKAELFARVWPDTFVDDSNLKSNILCLRRILGDRHDAPRYIATVFGRGYRFVADVGISGPSRVADDVDGRAQPWPAARSPSGPEL